MPDKNTTIGYLKYSGSLVDDGLLDARKAAKALIGFDELVRYFIAKDDPHFREVDFEIPVKIEKGSWVAAITDATFGLIVAGLGIFAASYLGTAGKLMAENDFKESGVGLKDVFKGALTKAQWMIKLAKHLGSLKRKQLAHVTFKNNNTILSIPNDNGAILDVPKEYVDYFSECPDRLFSKVSSLVESERKLSIGVYNEGRLEEVFITLHEKDIFYSAEEEEVLFPELVHGQAVELEGNITKGNQNTNIIGFNYNDHVLACVPSEGSIVRFRNNLFSDCKIIGVIDRNNKLGNPTEKKPKIIFSSIESMKAEEQNLTQTLF